ncbi:hypothetical protein ANCCAN_09201 [Ancylostoma caninum]|uniref:Surfactant protein B n=1 Tax=Ancylostoma caninum TaxID=29170 RepID=A0A368GK58_ANCCA|nr:hypothetical protein ANCCAN_09201 [Ancylostoma caninum]
MRAILIVLAALAVATVAINRDCKACLFITAVIKKAMVNKQKITTQKITGITCPILKQESPLHMEKVCKRVTADIVGSKALLKKIKRGKKLGNWMSYFCSRELPKKYCPDGYRNPKLFRQLSKI